MPDKQDEDAVANVHELAVNEDDDEQAVANLHERYPERTPDQIRFTLRRSKGHAGQAGRILRQHEDGPEGDSFSKLWARRPATTDVEEPTNSADAADSLGSKAPPLTPNAEGPGSRPESKTPPRRPVTPTADEHAVDIRDQLVEACFREVGPMGITFRRIIVSSTEDAVEISKIKPGSQADRVHGSILHEGMVLRKLNGESVPLSYSLCLSKIKEAGRPLTYHFDRQPHPKGTVAPPVRLSRLILSQLCHSAVFSPSRR